MSDLPGQGLSQDAFLGGKVQLLQPQKGYRAGMDAVMLAAAVEATVKDRVLDLGCGVGAASFCLMGRVPECRVVGVEIQPELAELALKNRTENQMEDRFELVQGDVTQPLQGVAPGSFNHVMLNPPYLEEGRGNRPPNRSKAVAHVEERGNLAEWITIATKMAKHKGSVTIVQRADRLGDILAATSGKLGEIVVFPLWPLPPHGENAKEARRVIVRGRKGLATPLRLAPGLVLHEKPEAYTAEAEAILRHGAPLHL